MKKYVRARPPQIVSYTDDIPVTRFSEPRNTTFVGTVVQSTHVAMQHKETQASTHDASDQLAKAAQPASPITSLGDIPVPVPPAALCIPAVDTTARENGKRFSLLTMIRRNIVVNSP